MTEDRMKKALEDFRHGKISDTKAMEQIRNLFFDDIGHAKVDLHRKERKGFAEVIFCQGKTTEQILGIMGSMQANGQDILATRAEKEVYDAVRKRFPSARYHDLARIIFLKSNTQEEGIGKEESAEAHHPEQVKAKKGDGLILIISAGTSDIPVAEEAAVTAECLGNYVERLYDVGVAGIHRLIAYKDKLDKAKVIIVVAGMEGALPSVVGGMTSKPIIAVPTSIGYGASFGGIAALLGMLNSCSPGVTVVNIDNGFGAGYFAGLINRNSRS